MLTLLLTPALADDFVTQTLTETPGFDSVVDSGPTALSSTAIAEQIASLEAEAASLGCSSEAWAGTWVRGRSPRLQGETASGASISGTSITDGSVDGVPFSASLAMGGRLEGATDDGTLLSGYFHRLSSRKAIWYGVEATCDSDSFVFPGQTPVEGAPMVLDFTGYNIIPALWAQNDVAQLAASGDTVEIQPGDVVAICPGSPGTAFLDFDSWTGHVFDVFVEDVIIVGQDIHVGTAFFAEDLSTTVIMDGGTSRVLSFGGQVKAPSLHVTSTTEVATVETEVVTEPIPFDTVHPWIDFGTTFDGCPPL